MRTLFFLALILSSRSLIGENSPAPISPPISPPQVKEASVEEIREQYWAKGRQGSLGVVQNRKHPRRHHLELSASGGVLVGNPSLSIKTAGATLGFHFTELISVHALYFKAKVGPSSALQELLDRGTAADTNEPQEFLGSEVHFNFAYGKLALTGTDILYLDAGLALGAGRILTETGGALLLSAGVGQHFHLGKSVSINLDYRLMTYSETVRGKIPGPSGTLGQTFGPRRNFSYGITLSVSILLNFASAEPKET